jgi:hypothetical protein
MGEMEKERGKEGSLFHSEKPACPRRGNSAVVKAGLNGRQTERGGKAFWGTKEFDRHPASFRDSHVASESRRPVEAIMGALCTGQGRRCTIPVGRETLLLLYFHALVTQQLHARPPIGPPTPVTPEKRRIPDSQWMRQHAHLAWLPGSAALPLALLTQLTGTTTANAGSIHQPQAPISLLPPFLERECVACRTAQRSIGLERKILSREATRFPGRGRGRWRIP